MRDFIDLTKPRITWLILMSAGIGYFFGLRAEGWRDWLQQALVWRSLHILLGTGLMASGTAALNEWYEREADRKMRRTADRPIPAGRVTPMAALIFGIAISAAGFIELAALVNLTSALLGLATLTSYLFVYTPLKRRSWLCTTAGAFPGALPPAIGFAGAHGSLNIQGVCLSAILFLWQFPHFYAIAWMYREDYARAEIQMLPSIEPDCASTVRQMILFAVALLPVSIAPAALGMTGGIYAVLAAALGVWLLWRTVRAAAEMSSAGARNVLLASVMYLPLLYGCMLLDRRW
jgi:protoheme IX farnesyltransferase